RPGTASSSGWRASEEGPQRPEPPRGLPGRRGGAQPSRRQLVLHGLRATAGGEPLAVPLHRRLERVLVRRRLEAELALRLRVLVGPPLTREADLLQADRTSPAGGLGGPPGDAGRQLPVGRV